ncbi:Cell surface antigen I/II [Dirofilaria immitis]
MRLSVKSPDGRIEVFDGVDNWSFSNLRCQVFERFNLRRDFTLFFGSRQLPTDDTKLFESDMEFVNGDRLRLVVNEKEIFPTDYASESSCPKISAKTGSSSLNSLGKSGTVFESILQQMKQRGFERTKDEDDDMRWTFHHPDSVLIVEIDFHIYNDRLMKYVHVTASIYHPFGRQFLEPVVLEEQSSDLQKKISECLISPLKLALFGHENPFLRLLGSSVLAECLFEMLDAESVLRLERTNKHALKICRSQGMERIWKLYCERDFGKDASVLKKESYREAYKRLYIRHVRELNYLRNLLEPHTHTDVPIHISFPTPTYRPENPDPDIPEGPFHPLSRNPYMPSINPFPFPGSGNPLDPFHGRELLPSRPARPSGIPRVLPRDRSTDQGNMYHDFL